MRESQIDAIAPMCWNVNEHANMRTRPPPPKCPSSNWRYCRTFGDSSRVPTCWHCVARQIEAYTELWLNSAPRRNGEKKTPGPLTGPVRLNMVCLNQALGVLGALARCPRLHMWPIHTSMMCRLFNTSQTRPIKGRRGSSPSLTSCQSTKRAKNNNK